MSASRGLNTLSGAYVIRKAVFSFEVSETGEPRNITVVSTDMDEDQVALSRRALEKAIYSPRFADSTAVTTAGVTFTGEWYVELDPNEKADPAPTQQAKEPSPAATEPASNSGR